MILLFSAIELYHLIHLPWCKIKRLKGNETGSNCNYIFKFVLLNYINFYKMERVKRFLKRMRLIDTGLNVNGEQYFYDYAKELHQLTD